MSAPIIRVSLRYRPGSDVLSGETDVRTLTPDQPVTESPDADSTMMWATDPHSPTQYLASFQFVHASARLDEHTLPLPADLTASVRRLIETARETIAAVTDPVARVRARAESSTTLPLDSLRRSEWPERPPGRRRVEAHQVADISTSLARLADAVQQRIPIDNETEAMKTDQLASLLNELSSTLSHGDGGTAPGTSAATRAAINEHIPLTVSEQRVLEHALDDLDDPVSWHRVPQSLDQLSEVLEETRHRE